MVDHLTYFLGGASFTVVTIFALLIAYRVLVWKEDEPITLEAIGMPLTRAKLCLDCDLVYNNGRDSSCPKCASLIWVYVSHWLTLPDGIAEQLGALELVYPGAKEGSNSYE